MKYELRPYQAAAAQGVLTNLERGFNALRQDWGPSSFALTALTGAGKTVIAASVIEAVLHGSADFGVEPNDRVAFLWLTDDPALNRQTMTRISEASDIGDAEMVEVTDTFDQHFFEPGHIYFLNSQKLHRTTRLARDGDGREFTIWQTIANTADSPVTDLVLVLDEAHRGMSTTAKDKSMVRHVIDGTRPANGDGAVASGVQTAPVPIVWGISATPQRFNKAMEGITGRTNFPAVAVSNDDIRASGLVKRKIVLRNTDAEQAATTLLETATREIVKLDELWEAHAKAEGHPSVNPVLVVQVPDMVSSTRLHEIVQTVTGIWPSLGDRAIRNVFGEHKDLQVAGRAVEYIEPDKIQGNVDVRVVLAKAAISTGWDCPRAEVLYSERPARDDTHIAQIVGRVVRTPLARHVADPDLLNHVTCYLPFFDEKAVGNVIDRLHTGDDAIAIVVERRTGDFLPVPELVEAGVMDLLGSLEAVPKPKPADDPIKRARKMAGLLADDGIEPDAGADLVATLNGTLDGLTTSREKDVRTAAEKLLNPSVKSTEYHYLASAGASAPKSSPGEQTQALASDRDVAAAFAAANRKIKDGVLKDYHKHRRRRAGSDPDTDLTELKAQVAILATLDGVAEAVEAPANDWVDRMLERHRVALPRRGTHEEYDEIRSQARIPEPELLTLPSMLTEPLESVDKDDSSKRIPIDLHDGHLYADADGKFAARLNGWEQKVLAVESERHDFVCWYRNPSAASKASLRIAYQHRGAWKSLQPDFIVISRTDSGLEASIIDPHGSYLKDATPKLKALAAYARDYEDQYRRVEGLAELDGTMRVLDLMDPQVRDAVLDWPEDDADDLYAQYGVDYS